jgi:uncharacterized repeat protein (TIGR03803 family)
LLRTDYLVVKDQRASDLRGFRDARGIAREGAYPFGAMALGNDGNFYGLTNYGGDPGPCGTVFRITPAGALAILHAFGATGGPDGRFPNSRLNLGTDGNFYGVRAG